ncbi:MAG: ACP S-malonyltransferase [Eubacteriales bacterium]|nr:ACP S-malonyltransferase [Eubacteriales bacterium]
MKYAFLYAGQGSQHAGMGKDLYEAFETFRSSIDESAAVLDFDLKKVMFEDPDGVINQTRYTQPVMAAFAVAMTKLLKEKGISPSVAAGLSLGEYAALYAAGVFDAETVVRTVAFRGAAMEEAAEGIDCAMNAVLGLDREKLKAACDKASDEGVVVMANLNCPGQIVIGGEKKAVEIASEYAIELGARRAMPLKVSGPFHTPFMAPAGEKLKNYFKDISFGSEQIPVIYNCLGTEKKPEDKTEELLIKQVQSSVFMEDSIRTIAGMDIDMIIEIGPGSVLSGFVKKTTKDVPVISVETVKDLEKIDGLQ